MGCESLAEMLRFEWDAKAWSRCKGLDEVCFRLGEKAEREELWNGIIKKL